MLQRTLCFFSALFFIVPALAQVDEIGFLFDDDDKPSVQTTTPKTQLPVTAPAVATEKPASRPIKFNQTQPNIGSNAEPLTSLDILPPPAPRLTIDLTDSVVQPVQPLTPVNTRVQGIDVSSNPLWDQTVGNISGGIAPLSDVRGFELEGFYLGMSPEEVLALAQENNYKVVSSKDAISKFRTGYYESLCKSHGIRAPEKIRACISQLSRQNDTSYLSTLKIARPRTRDYIEFSFSSPATNNRVWKIHYENKGDNSLNFTVANTRKKLDRQDAFLNAVYNKYGTPDNPQQMTWGSENDAFMRAGIYGSNYNAFITLTDVELSDEDYFEAKDWLEEAKPFEHFGFED